MVSDKPVFIQGVGASTGTWTVRKAYHDIELNGVYQMTLDVGSDGLGDSFDEFGQTVTPSLRPTRRVIDDYLHDRHEAQPNYYLHRSSVLPLVGRTGSQYVSAQWKSHDV